MSHDHPLLAVDQFARFVEPYDIDSVAKLSGVETDLTYAELWTLRDGKVAWGRQYWTRAEAVEAAAKNDIDCELIDLRTLMPFDIDTIIASVKKTGRCVIIHEATRTGGYGAELAALVQERCFYHLEAPIERVTSDDVPMPYAKNLEELAVPDVERIIAAVREVAYLD